MDKEAVIEKIRAKAIGHGKQSDWYALHRTPSHAEQERLRHKTCLDAMENLEALEVSDYAQAIDKQRYSLYNDYKFLQNEGFERLAEDALIQYLVYGEIETLCSSNQYNPLHERVKCDDCEEVIDGRLYRTKFTRASVDEVLCETCYKYWLKTTK